MLPPFDSSNISEFQMFTIYLLTLDSNIEDTLISSNLFPTLIGSVAGFSANSKTLLLDSLSNLVKNNFSPERFFTIRNLAELTRHLDLVDYSSQAKLLDILDSFLDVEESLDYEWVIFVCEDHINQKPESPTKKLEGIDIEAPSSQLQAHSKVTQPTGGSQRTPSMQRASFLDQVHALHSRGLTSTHQGGSRSFRNSNLKYNNYLFSMLTGSHVDHDLSKSFSNMHFARPEHEGSQHAHLDESEALDDESKLRFCRFCDASFECKKTFAVSKKIIEEVFAKSRSKEFERVFGQGFHVKEFTRGFSTVSVGTFRVCKFSLNHLSFKKMSSFVFGHLRQRRPASKATLRSSHSMSPKVLSSSHLKETTSVHLGDSDNLSVEGRPVSEAGGRILDPRHQFSLSNQQAQGSIRESLSKRTSELHGLLVEKNLSIIKENAEDSDSGESRGHPTPASSRPSSGHGEAPSEEPLRDSLFQKLLGLYPQECTCRELLSLEAFLRGTGDAAPVEERGHQIHLKERLTWYGQIFMSLIVRKNVFDQNMFVTLLLKFVRIFFTQHQPLKLFKMLSSENKQFPFCPHSQKDWFVSHKIRVFSVVVEKLVERQVSHGSIDFEIFADLLFVCFKNPFIFQSIKKFLIFKLLWEFLKNNQITNPNLAKKVA